MTDPDRAVAALDRIEDMNFETLSEDAARAFEAAGRRIEAALVKAAKTGEFSFRDMAESILKDLARIAAQQLITDPLQSILGVAGQGGQTASPPASHITINLSGVTDAQSFAQSQGQISAALTRAVFSGQRYL